MTSATSVAVAVVGISVAATAAAAAASTSAPTPTTSIHAFESLPSPRDPQDFLSLTLLRICATEGLEYSLDITAGATI